MLGRGQVHTDRYFPVVPLFTSDVLVVQHPIAVVIKHCEFMRFSLTGHNVQLHLYLFSDSMSQCTKNLSS